MSIGWQVLKNCIGRMLGSAFSTRPPGIAFLTEPQYKGNPTITCSYYTGRNGLSGLLVGICGHNAKHMFLSNCGYPLVILIPGFNEPLTYPFVPETPLYIPKTDHASPIPPVSCKVLGI